MKSIHPTILRGVLISLLLAVPDVLQAAESESQPDFSSGISKARPASAGAAKMGVELRDLSAQFTTTRGDSPDATYTAGQLQRQFGIVSGERQPAVEVSIRTSGTVDTNALAAVGAHLWFVDGDLMLARVPVGRLQQLAALDNVKSVRATSTVEIPPLPSSRVQPQLTRTRGAADEHKLADKFDRQGLDGSGVIVGIYDTGIDWRHEDFIKPDGTTRILYLYDPYDNSWQESGGTVGSSPPFELYGLPFGTLYTASQINDALAGRGKVNSVDKVGHGTACAGIAAGNGRATANGVPAGTYQGVAHKADLICVKLKPDDSGSFVKPLPVAVGVDWILSTARKLGKPCVVSMSFGGHFSAHDGNDPQELAIDRLLETHAPGTAAVVSAGNERQDNLHAAGRFAAARQPDTYSATVELYVESFTRLTAYFNAADDWGLRITGMDSFLVDEEGRPVGGYFYRVNDSLKGLAWSRFGKHSGPIVKKWEGPFMVMPPNNFAEYFERFVDVDDASDGLHRLVIGLPPGKYLVEGYGEGGNVVDGSFHLYLPFSGEASFGRGVSASELVGSPGNSARVITVGSYDFRREWQNAKETTTTYNLRPGELSSYSSPGFRLDGLVKPEITAPANYAISSLAEGCAMGRFGSGLNLPLITRDGKHLAWNGTSAAAPYVAGVIALMLQKNPNLDSEQIKKIIIETARKDNFTGAVPNREWGYGKIDPAAALKKVPISQAAAPKTPGAAK